MAFAIVVVGAPSGGSAALAALLAGLPKRFPVPVAVVQHRDEDDETSQAALAGRSALPVVEAEDKQETAPGHVYLAPAGYHLLVEDGSLALSTEAPVCSARPSIDVLFESAAEAYAKAVIGVLLTGAIQDGVRGAARITECGGLVVLQGSATDEGGALPESVSAADVGEVLPLSEIASFLTRQCASL
jgi:two-component system chemotaxis response regulator CheB